MKKALFLIISLVILANAISIKATNSYFSDQETSINNIISAADDFDTASPVPSPSPSPSPSPTPTLPDVVINEVYYDVAPDKGNEGDQSNPDEWIELYNNTDDPVNLKDWTINDNSYSRTVSHSNVYIPGKGFALLAKSANTWTYWTIPSSAEKISLGQKIGNGLGNTGDRLILKNDLEQIVDQMSYGDDATILDPSCLDVPEGHSLERDPDGKDTNNASDFTDRSPPTPGS